MKTIRTREQKIIQLVNIRRSALNDSSNDCFSEIPFKNGKNVESSCEDDDIDDIFDDLRMKAKEEDTFTEQGYHPANKSFIKRPSFAISP